MAGTFKVVIPVCFGIVIFIAFIAVVAVRCFVNWRRQKRKKVALVNNSLHMLVRSTQPLDFVPLLIQEKLEEERQEEEIDVFYDVESPFEENATSKEDISSQQRMQKKSMTGRHSLKRRSISDTSLYTYGERFPDLDPSGPITSLRRESQFFDAAVGRGRSLSTTQSDGSENEVPFGSGSALDTKPSSSMTFPRQRKHPIVTRRATEDIIGMSRSIAAAKKAGLHDPAGNAQKSIASTTGTTAKRSSHLHQRRFSMTTKPSYTDKTPTSIKKPKMPMKRGRVDFKITYLQERHTLQVHLINATELPMKHGNLLNSFARLSIRTPSKHQRHQSRVHKRTCNPIFDEMFVFDGVHAAELPQTWLKIKLLNRDSISMFERIGETMLSLSDENLLRGDTVSRELVDKAKRDQCVGQLLLFVYHHATSSQVKVTIVKLKDLPKSTKSIFVTLELTYEGHTLQKHQSKTRRQNISFNEEFSFVVSTDSSCTLENFGVQFTVYQRDFIHGNEVIGRVRLGMDAPLQSEVDHWRAVVLSPHTSIAGWHRLHDNP